MKGEGGLCMENPEKPDRYAHPEGEGAAPPAAQPIDYKKRVITSLRDDVNHKRVNTGQKKAPHE